MHKNGTAPKGIKADVEEVLDDGDEIEEEMRPWYYLLLQLAWEDSTAVIGVEIIFGMDDPFVKQVIDQLALKVRNVTEQTRADIADLVAQQIDEGWTVEELAEKIRQRGITESVRRAKLIAATESATAYNQGAVLYYQQSGVVDSLEWVASNEPCEQVCKPLGGKRVALGDEFASGITAPPAHPACRCTIAPVIE